MMNRSRACESTTSHILNYQKNANNKIILWILFQNHTRTSFPPLGAGAHLQHCPVGREGSRAPCLSWRCGCAGCTTRAIFDDDDDDDTDDDDDDSDGDGGDNGGRWWSFVNNAVFHYVTNKGNYVLFSNLVLCSRSWWWWCCWWQWWCW